MVEHMWFICCSAKREPTIQPPFWPRDLLRPMSPGQCSAQSCFQFCDPPPCETTPWTESLTCYSFHPSPILRSHWFIRRTSQSAPCLMFNKYCTSLKTRASPQRSLKREQNSKAVAKPGWKSRSYSRLSFFLHRAWSKSKTSPSETFCQVKVANETWQKKAHSYSRLFFFLHRAWSKSETFCQVILFARSKWQSRPGKKISLLLQALLFSSQSLE